MKKKLSIIIFALLFLTGSIFAQNNFHERGHVRPDSLIEVTVTGTVIIDTTYLHHVYFLDENGDGLSDYHLNFGPWWYTPDSSAAIKPINGETVTVKGGMHESPVQSYNVIIVYEINGGFWREPFEPFWNNFSRENHIQNYSEFIKQISNV